MIVAIDPSSTRCGFACMNVGTLIECGAFKPRGQELDQRMKSLRTFVMRLVDRVNPEHIVIEWPAPQAPSLGQRGQGVYGVACGVAWSACLGRGADVHTVRADVWTRRVAKDMRALWVQQQYPKQYNVKSDRGLDVADAIGLARWWMDEYAVEITIEPRESNANLC